MSDVIDTYLVVVTFQGGRFDARCDTRDEAEGVCEAIRKTLVDLGAADVGSSVAHDPISLHG